MMLCFGNSIVCIIVHRIVDIFHPATGKNNFYKVGFLQRVSKCFTFMYKTNCIVSDLRYRSYFGFTFFCKYSVILFVRRIILLSMEGNKKNTQSKQNRYLFHKRDLKLKYCDNRRELLLSAR